jgi:ParB family chromosome partitioning protein
MFDLSQFDKAPMFAPDNQIGIVLSLPLDKVIEDPTQPRTEFDAEELTKLSEDIARRGVQAPISVRPPVEGLYQIIHGARRFRASGLAGLPAIPAIVQADELAFDDYSQVLENTQRDNLTALDIARFIQKRKALGETNSQIARNLSEKPEWVTYHLALIDMPPEIQQAYDAGQVTGAKATYELRKLHGKDPDAVKELIASGEEITQVRIREVATPAKTPPIVQVETTVKSPAPELQSMFIGKMTVADLHTPVVAAVVQQPHPEHLMVPAVIGIYQGAPVQILFQLKPSEPGVVWIRSPESDAPQEVLADQITLSRIEEATP